MSKSLAPKILTAADLRNIALRHLARYASSTDTVRRLLQRTLLRRAQGDGSVATDNAAVIEMVLARLTAAGLLDDERYAEARLQALARRGGSVQRMRGDLVRQGVDAAVVKAVLSRYVQALRADGQEADRLAAAALARRRRLGPYRPAETRAAQRQRDLASLVRAGFSYAVAAEIVDASGDDRG